LPDPSGKGKVVSMFPSGQLAKGSLFLGSLGLLLASLAACTAQPQITLHANYQYNIAQAPRGATFQEQGGYYKLGYEAHVPIIWEASSDGERLMNVPLQVVLTAKLFGPYGSLEALKQSSSDNGRSDGPAVALAPPLHTDSWTNKTQLSFLPLPTRLAAGYYRLVEDFCSYGKWYVTSAGEVGGVDNGCSAEASVPLYIAR
jgi:hypothetical protein